MKFTATSLRLALLPLTLLLVDTTVAQQSSKLRVKDSPAVASEKRSGNNFHSSFAGAEFAFSGRVIVKGAPFSAVATSETVQALSDGNRLTRSRTARVYRDGEGRVRLEFGKDARDGRAFMLFDAVSGASYILGGTRRVALQLWPPATEASLTRANVITPQSPPENVRAVAGEKIESLGTRSIEGVEAEGVRVTSTIPAKAGSAKQPAVVVYERWYSHELRRDVLIKCSDPRFGEAVYRLTGIKRVEPAHDLFTVPADYRIEPAFGEKSGGSKLN